MVIFKPHTEVKYELDCAWEVFINENEDINRLDPGRKIQFERILCILKDCLDYCFQYQYQKGYGALYWGGAPHKVKQHNAYIITGNWHGQAKRTS